MVYHCLLLIGQCGFLLPGFGQLRGVVSSLGAQRASALTSSYSSFFPPSSLPPSSLFFFFLHQFIHVLAPWFLFFFLILMFSVPTEQSNPQPVVLPFFSSAGRSMGSHSIGTALGGRGRNGEAAGHTGEEGAGVAVVNYPDVLDVVLTFSLQLVGLSVSNGKDQLVVFHTKDNKDLIVCLFSKEPSNDNRIGELVGVLASHFKRSVLQTHYSQIQNFP